MASQQPPTRPWFRLASASRPTQAPARAPPQAQALPVAEPRPPIIRSTFTLPFPNPPTQPAQLPPAPPTQAPTALPVSAPPPPRAKAPPTAPAPKSPPPQPATVPPATAFPPIRTAPPPRATAPPPASAQKSPPPRAAATPPSPVTIAASNGRNHSTDITRQDGKPDVRKDNGNYKKQSDSEEFGKRAITVAGENKGAIMEWIHKNGGNPRTWSDGEKYGSESDSSNEEGRGKSKDKSYKARTNSSQPMSAFMNSNVQGVNNSILCNCSYSHDDPGLHFSLSRKANGHGNGVNPNNKHHTNRQNI